MKSFRLALAAAAALAAPSAAAAEAAPLPLMPADRSELSQAIRRQFVTPMITNGEADTPFRWARADLDRDGYDELIIQLTSKALCTEFGCPIIAFRRVNGAKSWRPILTEVAKTLERPAGGDVALKTHGAGEAKSWTYDAAQDALKPVRTP